MFAEQGSGSPNRGGRSCQLPGLAGVAQRNPSPSVFDRHEPTTRHKLCVRRKVGRRADHPDRDPSALALLVEILLRVIAHEASHHQVDLLQQRSRVARLRGIPHHCGDHARGQRVPDELGQRLGAQFVCLACLIHEVEEPSEPGANAPEHRVDVAIFTRINTEARHDEARARVVAPSLHRVPKDVRGRHRVLLRHRQRFLHRHLNQLPLPRLVAVMERGQDAGGGGDRRPAIPLKIG